MFGSKFAGLVAVSALAISGSVGCAANQNGGTPAEPARMSALPTAVHTTSKFQGVKANSGTVTATHPDGKIVLTWSDDFKIPDTPAPHWQVVDSRGNVYLLQRLKIKEDKLNRTITVPLYIKDVVKVQIWCAYAEVLLGEASFSSSMM